jgi:hypothetical protein
VREILPQQAIGIHRDELAVCIIFNDVNYFVGKIDFVVGFELDFVDVSSNVDFRDSVVESKYE